ncbi:MAG: amidohydrolase [Proteobacteria bacterium]|nr:amidohydrolase [Pseudomonadota bacterium]MBU1698284.1 amidohydrolase [Pseudomonadota bacterium]
MTQKKVIVNANIITMASKIKDLHCRALAIENGHIAAVGSEARMANFINQGWPIEDFNGKTVLPGFIDTHEHLMLTGSQETSVHLDKVVSKDEILELMSDRASITPKGDWVNGSFLNEQNIKEKTMPTRDDLDRAIPDHPVFIMHVTCHMCSLNTKALEILNLPLDLEGLDLKGGEPTGLIRDPGILTFVHPAMADIVTADVKLRNLLTAAGMALKKGITTVHALDGGLLGPGDTAVIWQNRHQLPIHVVCYNQSMNIEEVKDLDLPRIGGCICSDGAFEAHTAALFEPYSDEPNNYGTLTYSQEKMDDFILAANREGLQIAIHCESERSIEQVLWAMEKALKTNPRKDHRHRIEHLELPTFNQIKRMAKAGIMASMQPAFIPAFIGQKDMAIYEELLGKTRLERVHPYRTILNAGIPISGGSDSPVTPYDPLKGIQAAVNHPNPLQRVSVFDAIAMFTSTAAWSAFEENEKGTLEKGKFADLVVLENDPFKIPTDQIQDIEIHSVFIKGKRHLINKPVDGNEEIR